MAERRPGGTLVLGLGNPILGDDGVGWAVLDALGQQLPPGAAELDRLAVGGLAVMERMVGYDRTVLVDALLDGAPAGTVTVAPLAELTSGQAGHLDSAHDVSLPLGLRAGEALGAPLPTQITVVGISVPVASEFGEELSPAVAAAIGPALEAVLAVLGC